jgi:hypothetical protein
MKRTVVFTAAAAVAIAPAIIGLTANPSLSRAVPVTVPSQAPALVDDHGGEVDRDLRTEPGDDRDLNGSATVPAPGGASAPTASPSAVPGASGDDHGGLTDRDLRTEPGDDRRPNGTGAVPAPAGSGNPDDSGHRSGSGSGSGSDDGPGDDRGGHGSDDVADDHGGHGSDD